MKYIGIDQKKKAAVEANAAIRSGTNKVVPSFSIEGEGDGEGASSPAAMTPLLPRATTTIIQIVKTIANFFNPSIDSLNLYKFLKPFFFS